MFLEPTKKYVDYIERSAHYLNCPKHMFNHDLDSLYRQGIGFSKDKAIEFVERELEFYKFKKPHETAIKWIEWRETLTTQEFNKLNLNPYVDNLPPHIKQIDNRINAWFEKNTTYTYGYKSVKSYPFAKR